MSQWNNKSVLRCSINELKVMVARYSYLIDDAELTALEGTIKKRGSMTLGNLRAVAKWKSPRSARHVETNQPDFVEEITGLAFAAKSEQARVELLTLLHGVSWPTASVILHLYHREEYPIIDFRALWTLGQEVPSSYKFPFWWRYVEECRALAKKADLSMRDLDRALWQYSKENQRSES